jgi:hypothetical protein
MQTVQYKVSDWYATPDDLDTTMTMTTTTTEGGLDASIDLTKPYFLVNRQASALKKHVPMICIEAQRIPQTTTEGTNVSADPTPATTEPKSLSIDGTRFLVQPCTFSERTQDLNKIRRQTFYYDSASKHMQNAGNRGYCIGADTDGTLLLTRCESAAALQLEVTQRVSKIQGFSDPYTQVRLGTEDGRCLYFETIPTIGSDVVKWKIRTTSCTETSAATPAGLWWSLVTA